MKKIPFVLLLALPACAVDNNLGASKEDNAPFDPGSDTTPPITETEDTTGSTTGGTTLPDYCDDRFFGSEAVELSADCDGGPTTPDWEFEELWSVSIRGGAYTQAVVGQLSDDNGDGVTDAEDTPDVLVLDSSGYIQSVNGLDGSTQWSTYMSSTMGGMPTIGDVDSDGEMDFVMDNNYSTTAFSGSTGSILWVGPYYSMKNKGSCGAHGISDLDGDGEKEVHIGGTIIDGMTGDLRGSGDEGDGTGVGNTLGISVAVDLDDDGVQEVVVGNAAYDPDGNTIWSNGGHDGTVAIADFDLDGSPEIASVGNYGLSVMDSGGNELWSNDLGGALVSTPVIADLDGDGQPELIIPAGSELMVFDGNGNEFWSLSGTGSSYGRGGASAYDLDGDGAWEVIWSGPSGLMVLDGLTGETLMEESMGQPTCAGPVPVADLDGDGHAEIIAVDSNGTLRALRDTSGFTTARTVWNQAAYSYTNVEDDGGIPQEPTPNWKLHNNFRAGPAIPHAQNLYPVIRDVCSDECDSGTIWIWYSVANNGNLDVSDNVEIEIWGTTDTGTRWLASDTISANFVAGEMTEGVYLEIPSVTGTVSDISVRIVGHSNNENEECSTDDDTVSWGLPVCP